MYYLHTYTYIYICIYDKLKLVLAHVQDAVFKKQCRKSMLEKMECSCQILCKQKHVLTGCGAKGDTSVSMPYLESIAQIRFALSVVAELLFKQNQSGVTSHGCHTHTAHFLIQVAKDYCTDDSVNDEDSGPAVYLVKLLVRQYGMSFLTTLTADPVNEWIVPPHLRGSDKASVTIIILVFFMLYMYLKFRTLEPWISLSFTSQYMLI